MTRSSLTGLRRHFTLLRTFGLLSAVMLAAIAVLLAWNLDGQMTSAALNQETVSAEGQVQSLLHAGLLPQDTGDRLSSQTLRYLATYTAANLKYDGNVRVKIWSPDGTILYSDASQSIGHRFPLGDDELEVLEGQVASRADISDLSDPENSTERGHFRDLLEVYVPIRLTNGHIVGLYEVYHSLDALDSAQNALRQHIWFVVSVGFLILYLSLFVLVGSASRRLTLLLAETRRREADATLLYRVGERLRLDADRASVFHGVLDAVRTTFGYLSCTLHLYRTSDGRLYPHIGAGEQSSQLWPAGIALGQGFIGRAAAERRLISEPEISRASGSAADGSAASQLAVPLVVGDELLGVFHAESARPGMFGERDLKVLSVLADQIAMALQNANLYAQQEALYLAVLETIARTIDARDPYTAGHSQRVAAYAVAIGQRLELDSALLRALKRGGLVHDIGKIGVSDLVLRKPGPLTTSERLEMEKHPLIGYELLQALPFLLPELPIIRNHHERWDGFGYPDGLAQESIHLAARVVAVADSFDAMTSDRPYRAGMTVAEARKRLLDGSGTQFWPPAVTACVALLDEGEIQIGVSGVATAVLL